ncbi:MAG: 16S rRNA (guanine(527)-N(7))-methyltransferase RsmG, partial [Candidatus Binataceae bacterium]|jgi:16S rRNA (guanine527-N7)-methyltransferase
LVVKSLEGYPHYHSPAGFMDRIERFAAELALWGSKFNLTATPDDPAELAFHILDSLAPILIGSREPASRLAAAFTTRRRVLDLGSGAGFPGIVLASATDAQFVLAESRRKRASFLQAAVTALGLSNARINHRHRRSFEPEFDIVTARAFAQPEVFYATAGTALRPGGIAILFASASQQEEITRILHRRGEVFTAYAFDPPRQPSAGEPDTKAVSHLIMVSSISD